ncbi:hypothetical protein PR202_gb24317 [Eleusine coracana subsp. coracana]|uniref:RCK N-terminal domain-containing protein n=1 Tax=Eleusine coracana subsp. coracana TaxID=191504 RepID=A0AAV5FKP8_ELECO|nr:hypothetical protein PR202_gb24317 [Eleusine coracana subsp. coracana]
MAAAAAAAAAAAQNHVLLSSGHYRRQPARQRRLASSVSVCCVLRPSCRCGAWLRRPPAPAGRVRFRAPRAGMDMDLASGAVEVINDLGFDTLTFLGVTVLVVPAFRVIKASPVKYRSPVVPSAPLRPLSCSPHELKVPFAPDQTLQILGFFGAGVVLNQFGLIRNITDVKLLSEWGILFLLFEMGLELSLSRLKALARYAFGMGLPQVLLSTLAFTAFELPPNNAIGTKILQFFFDSRPDLVNIRSVDEAIVIGAALSLSSSAFVLQLLAEKGELPTRFGSATLGILLLQDIAVVPLLVILPVLESQNIVEQSVWPILLAESLKALGGLGILSLGGKYLIRRIFEFVAESRSSEAFVALCLLTVAGTSLLTQKLGFSDTLLIREWPNVLSLLGGLIAIKTLIITAIGPRVGLTLQESVRIGLLLSQGGEFGFVVFSLANRLGVLPLELNKLLIIVVVLSMMALTPLLNEVGRRAAGIIDERSGGKKEKPAETVNYGATEPIVILGFGEMGQILAKFLSAPLSFGLDQDVEGWPYVAFDLNPAVVKVGEYITIARELGFPVLYGDGSRPAVLQSASISFPKAVMVMYTGKEKTIEAVSRLRQAFAATSLQLGSILLKGLGVMSDDVSFFSKLVRVSDFESNGKGSRTIAQKQSLSLSKRPEVILVKKKPAGNLIPDTMEVENDKSGYDLEDIESGDGVKYCPLETSDDNCGASSTSKEMVDQSA